MRDPIRTFFLKLGAFLYFSIAMASAASGVEDFLVTKSQPGTPGGKLVVAERSEPKTLNPLTELDGPWRDVIRRMTADLIRINRSTQQTEPALAKSWAISADMRVYTLKLRRGVKFSGGHAFDADDVTFHSRSTSTKSASRPTSLRNSRSHFRPTAGAPVGDLYIYGCAFSLQPHLVSDRSHGHALRI